MAAPVAPLPPPPPPAPPAPVVQQWSVQPRPNPWVARLALLRRVPLLVFLLVSFAVRTLGLAPPGWFGANPVAASVDPAGFRPLGLDPETKQPMRFDPCSPVHYVINPELAPRRGVQDIHDAADKTAEATGMKFVFDGFTDEAPRADRAAYQPELYGDRWAPVLVAWEPGEIDPDEIHSVGRAQPDFKTNSDGRIVLVSGQIVLNASESLYSGFVGTTWGKVVLHEFGHIVGLDHVDDERQIMNPLLQPTPVTWGSGDLAGLQAVGIEAGCIRAPQPA